VVTPSTALRDGQTVVVSVTGFGVGGKVWLSECSSAAAATDLGCEDGLPLQPFLVTGDDRSGSTSFTVKATASDKPLSGTAHTCTDQCVIVATVGVGFPFVLAPLHFTR
jgi:hypothetical protein